jgi:hypothetical protein
MAPAQRVAAGTKSSGHQTAARSQGAAAQPVPPEPAAGDHADVLQLTTAEPRKIARAARARTSVPLPPEKQPEGRAETADMQTRLTPTPEPATSPQSPSAAPHSAQNSPVVPASIPPPNPQNPPQTYPAQSVAASLEPHVVTLPAGTTLSVRLGETLSSDKVGTGDTFQATLDTPVVVDGFIIAERRSKVAGRVVEANRAGRVKGLANLALAVSEINTTDGQQVRIETDSYEKWGNSSVKSDTAKVAGAAAIGAIIGALAGGGKGAAIGAGAGGAAGTGVALGTRGSAVSVPSESILTFRLARLVTITEKFN